MTIIAGRYELHDKLGQGGMGIVYRAVDRLTSHIVALKQVTTPSEQIVFASSGASTDFRLALATEFKILASLRHPNIISVLDYGFDSQKQPFFTMEYLENGIPISEYGEDKSVEEQIKLLVQALQALAYLHRRGIYHRDLKPANILVEPDSAHVKVLDFGLAVAHSRLQDEEEDKTVGTLAYLAPEIIQGAPASAASDLYALGIIAYELLIGEHPFDVKDITVLVEQILYQNVDTSELDIDERVRNILGKLLRKDPQDRYQSSLELLEVYAELFDDDSIELENQAIRESYLQAAAFVGRNQEINLLQAALDKIMMPHQKHSGFWLVGGESGVGKTRLLEELRTRAMVQGARVIRGQATSDIRAPYQTWHEVLRYICLYTNLSDFEIGVLKSLVPDIEILLQRTVTTPPDLDPQAHNSRLVQVVQDILIRQEHPLVIILEDLQWSRDSVKMLRRISDTIEQAPLFIVGSYRHDERPDLPKELPAMQVMILQRLSRDTIAELSSSMLGEHIGQRSEIVDLLHRETEGNAFFIVEVMRTLAEDAGALANIGYMTLPASVFAGGVKTVIQRRLDRLPENTLPLLQLAAIIGRKIDIELMKNLAGGIYLDMWLTNCANASVLEVIDDTWRFAHDKLREGILEALSPEEYQRLSRNAALAIERVYPESQAWLAPLARLWGDAGDLKKEGHYCELAGIQALQHAAHSNAIEFLSRALQLANITDISTIKQATTERLIAQAYWGTEHLGDAIEHLHIALKLLGKPFPRTSLRTAISLARGAGRQLLHRLIPRFRKRGIDQEILVERTRVYALLAHMHYFRNESIDLIHATFHELNTAESLNITTPELARAYSSMAVIISLIPLRRLTEGYVKLAYEALDKVDDMPAAAWVATAIGAYRAGVGELDKSLTYWEHAIELGTKMGDLRRVGDGYGGTVTVRRWQGKYDEMLQDYQQLHEVAKKSGDIQHLVWALDGYGFHAIYTGRNAEALTLIEETAEYLENDQDVSNKILNLSCRSLAYLRIGNHDAARVDAQRMVEMLNPTTPALFSLMDSYSAPAEIYLKLWEQNQQDTNLQKSAKHACKQMKRYAHIFPVGQARAHIWQGVYEQLSGNHEKANNLWEKAIQAARQHTLPYEEGLAHYFMGYYLAASNPQRMAHLDQAAAIFEQLGAAWHLKQTQAAYATE